MKSLDTICGAVIVYAKKKYSTFSLFKRVNTG